MTYIPYMDNMYMICRLLYIIIYYINILVSIIIKKLQYNYDYLKSMK